MFRSPLRGPWLTTALGSVLLVLVTIVAVTGFLSHAAYLPDLQGNAIVPRNRDFPLGIGWPASPTYLFAITQGLHTNVGLVAIPFLLAKLWSVIPKLFEFPPIRSVAHGIERLSIALLVSSSIFELATGVVNAQYWYAFKFNFVVAHYYGAIVFVSSLALHVVVKLPTMRAAYGTRKEVVEVATMSRRGLFAFAGAGALTLLAANAGQTIGGPLRRLAFLAPRREDFPVNKRAAIAGITPELTGPNYRLFLRAGERVTILSREQLLALPQRTARLPIACVEGWTTTQTWTGVPLAALARHAGAPDASEVFVESLQPKGVLRHASLNRAQITAPDALLALKVNGHDLPLDHGYPARIIVPALPGVHNTKWVARMTFT